MKYFLKWQHMTTWSQKYDWGFTAVATKAGSLPYKLVHLRGRWTLSVQTPTKVQMLGWLKDAITWSTVASRFIKSAYWNSSHCFQTSSVSSSGTVHMLLSGARTAELCAHPSCPQGTCSDLSGAVFLPRTKCLPRQGPWLQRGGFFEPGCKTQAISQCHNAMALANRSCLNRSKSKDLTSTKQFCLESASSPINLRFLSHWIAGEHLTCLPFFWGPARLLSVNLCQPRFKNTTVNSSIATLWDLWHHSEFFFPCRQGCGIMPTSPTTPTDEKKPRTVRYDVVAQNRVTWGKWRHFVTTDHSWGQTHPCSRRLQLSHWWCP